MKFTTKLIVAATTLVFLFGSVEFYVRARIGKHQAEQAASAKSLELKNKEIELLEADIQKLRKESTDLLEQSKQSQEKAKTLVQEYQEEKTVVKADAAISGLSTALEELNISNQSLASASDLQALEISVLKGERKDMILSLQIKDGMIFDLERKVKRESTLKWIGFALAAGLLL